MIDLSIDSLIRAIYDCVIDPSGWDKVLQRIAAETHAVSATMLTYPGQPGPEPKTIARWNIDPFYAKAYRDHYYTQNPFIPLRLSRLTEIVQIGDCLTKTAPYRASSFFNEFAKPQEWESFIGINLYASGSSDVLSLMHSRKTDYTESGIDNFLAALAPHLRRAYDLSGLLAKARQTTAVLGEAIAAAGFGAILLNEKCRILFANQIAEDLLREQRGLTFIRGELVAEATPLNSKLAALVQACLNPHTPISPFNTMLTLPRRGTNQPIFAHVLPVKEKAAVILADRARPAAVLFLLDPQRNLSNRLKNFANSFFLTSIEIAIMGEIIQSESLSIVAAKLEVSPSFLRTHLGHLMTKTGTANRLELIRKFFETASFPSL